MGRAALLAVVLVLAAGARAELGQDSVAKFERQLDQLRRQAAAVNPEVPADRRALFDYGGSLSADYLSIDDVDKNNHGLRQYELLGYARLNIDGAHELFARGRLTYLDYNPGDSFDGEGDDLVAEVERAYYRFDLQRALAAYSHVTTEDNFVFQGGRQFVYWANGLVFSRTIDGVILGSSTGPVDLQLVAGVTPQRTVDFDSSRPHFDDHTFRGFYGGMLTADLGAHRPFAYALYQRDYNHGDRLLTPLSPTPILTRFDYNSYYLGAGSAGSITDRLLYGLELAYEGGGGLSNSFDTSGGTISPIPQVKDPIRAWAGDVRLDYVVTDRNRTRLSAEFLYASGDRDRLHTSNTFGGNTPHTTDHAFNAFGSMNTGIAFAPNPSNLMFLRGGISTFPFEQVRAIRNLQFGADLFLYFKADRLAPIDEPTRRGRVLGVEPDLFINWQIRSDVTLALRYGLFVPNGDVISNDFTRQFFFAGVTFAF